MSSLLLKFSLYSSVLNIVFTPFSNVVAKTFGYITIILFLASTILASYHENKMIMDKDVFGMLFAIVAAFVVSIPSLQILSIEDLKDQLMPVISFIAFYIMLSDRQIWENTIVLENIFYINYVLCAAFMVFSFCPFDFKYEIVNEYGDKLFTMGLGNPNAVSLCVMFSIVILMLQYDRLVKFYSKMISIIVIITMFYILFLLSSRSVLFCALMVAIVFLFRNLKFSKWRTNFILLAPLLSILLQLFVLKDNNTVQILNKAINTGRPEIYAEILKDIFSSPTKAIFGNLCNNNFYNYHNGLLTILSSIGLNGVVMYLIFWNKQLRLLQALCINKNQKIAFIAIITILLHASSESMGVIGTIPYSIFVVIIMKIARGEIVSRYD